MKKELVVKDNALINASYNLSLTEQRLILLAIIEARQTKTSTENDLTVYAKSYINHFNVHKNTAYQALKDACENLFERRFSYEKLTAKGNIEHIKSRWVQKISYVENEALVRIKFSSDVVPLITNLEQHFTSYELEQVSELSSAYSVRLYELLIAWRSTGKTPKINLDELRNKLGVAYDEYPRMDNFKRKVLDASIKQINDHTDITVNYEQHKRGRSISGFSFIFKQKNIAKVVSKNPKRQPITKREAEAMAHVGESWNDLLDRLTTQYHITDLWMHSVAFRAISPNLYLKQACFNGFKPILHLVFQ